MNDESLARTLKQYVDVGRLRESISRSNHVGNNRSSWHANHLADVGQILHNMCEKHEADDRQQVSRFAQILSRSGMSLTVAVINIVNAKFLVPSACCQLQMTLRTIPQLLNDVCGLASMEAERYHRRLEQEAYEM